VLRRDFDHRLVADSIKDAGPESLLDFLRHSRSSAGRNKVKERKNIVDCLLLAQRREEGAGQFPVKVKAAQ
jgi:hypothetical protein